MKEFSTIILKYENFGGLHMPYDGVFLHFLTEEFKTKLVGRKINKIIEPNNLDIVLQVRTKTNSNEHKHEQLLISSSLDMPRMYLTDEKFTSLDVPKNFCILLRKYIERGIIKDIYQIQNDRIIVFEVEGYSELGDATFYKLIVELMGRNSNVILVDSKNSIIDAMRKVPPSEDGGRLVLPKATYVYPLQENKVNPFTLDENSRVDFSRLEGCSKPLLHACDSIFTLVHTLKSPPLPYIYQTDTKYDFYLLPLSYTKIIKQNFQSISEMLCCFYQEYKAISTDKAKELKKIIKQKITKLQHKVTNLNDDLDQAAINLDCNHLGLLLQSNLYKVKKGDTSITVEDYTDENKLIEIKLDPFLDPSKNLKKLFIKGKKAKTALEVVSIQKELTIKEIHYLETILVQIDFATSADLDEIRSELVQNKYLKESKKKEQKRKKLNLTKYILDGVEVLVGKNNLQNDAITNTLARPFDWWFHVKDAPGSHVLFRSPTPNYTLSEKEIRFCANLAASYSKLGKSSTVPVDYLLAKYTKKIPGLKGCEVTYTNQKTIYIDPKIQ